MSLEIILIVLQTLALAALAVFHFRERAGAERRESAQAERHAELMQGLQRLQANADAAESRALQRNSEQLADALKDVISDFQHRIVAGFDSQLATLTALAAGTAEQTAKHRNEQMEAMHHARRLADRMDSATRDFGKLVGDNTELLALAGQVRDALSLLGARQDALDGDVRRQAESVQAMESALRELRTGFEQAAENLLQQTRRSLDAMAQRQAQANGTLQKELNDSLTKALAGISKQQAIRAADIGRTMRQ